MQPEATPEQLAGEKPKAIALWLRRLALLAIFLVAFRCLPPLWCGRDAVAWWQGDVETQTDLARSVERWISQPLKPEQFQTGAGTFDGEWLFGTYQMAVLGLAQVAHEHPEQRTECLRQMELAEDRILQDHVREFDRREWKEDPLDALDGPNGHAGFLGYFNVSLSAHRQLDPHLKHRALHDRISGALARNLAASAISLIETYPHQTFPVDNCAVAASLMLHDRADGTNRFQAVYQRWLVAMKARYTDPKTGLLIQAVNAQTGVAGDAPRGSGTLLGAYFLGLAGEPFAADLYRAARKELFAPFAGFGAVREYPVSFVGGTGDIDSGPLIFGRSISASGLMLGCARQQRDEATFRSIYRSVHLFGAPTRESGRTTFAVGGPLGDALMLALLTAQPVERAVEGGGQ